jgi:penicillin-binding protein 1B
LALVGGRDYGFSQFNHAASQRPTGSIFKPFVYAAAFEAGLSGRFDRGAFSPTSTLNDERQTYADGYSPRNYHGQYHGEVTAQYALAHSLNNATVELAREVGFDNVAELARAAGVGSAQGTPSVALGAYAASPLQMAGAYTVFANEGIRMEPSVIRSIRTEEGDVIEGRAPAGKQVLDPRISYLTLSLMQNVIEHGSGQEVRRRGFLAPAAGKTGTSHDAWFAGFTSNLLCIVWVGNDDYSDIKLAGGQAAAPIWAEFMKRAVRLPQYADAEDFEVPEGVVRVWLDAATNRPSEPETGEGYYAAFLAGTEPK